MIHIIQLLTGVAKCLTLIYAIVLAETSHKKWIYAHLPLLFFVESQTRGPAFKNTIRIPQNR
jgi:hypothetical protein